MEKALSMDCLVYSFQQPFEKEVVLPHFPDGEIKALGG